MESLDNKVVMDLKELMGDDYTAVYDAFIRSSDTAINELQHAVNNNNIGDVEKLSHTLKGSSANIGANQFSRLCMNMLTDARNGTAQNFEVQCQAITAEYRNLVISIKRLLE